MGTPTHSFSVFAFFLLNKMILLIFCIYYVLDTFFFFLATPVAYGSSQTRDQTPATVATQATAVTVWILNPLHHRRTPHFLYFLMFVYCIVCTYGNTVLSVIISYRRAYILVTVFYCHKQSCSEHPCSFIFVLI